MHGWSQSNCATAHNCATVHFQLCIKDIHALRHCFLCRKAKHICCFSALGMLNNNLQSLQYFTDKHEPIKRYSLNFIIYSSLNIHLNASVYTLLQCPIVIISPSEKVTQPSM